MTAAERQLVEQSWAQVVGTSPREFKTAGVNLVLWMFDNIPTMRDRFSKFQAKGSDSELAADQMFLMHANVLINNLDSIVKLLENPPHLKEKLQTLAKSHLGQTPPVGSENFQVFADKFHLFLKSTLAHPQSDEIKAWEKLLNAFVDMVKAEEGQPTKVVAVPKKKRSLCCVIL